MLNARSFQLLIVVTLIGLSLLVAESEAGKRKRKCRYNKRKDECRDVMPREYRKIKANKCPCIKTMGLCASEGGRCVRQEETGRNRKCSCEKVPPGYQLF